MNALVWIGLLVDVALLVWLVISIKAIKIYLRRIALSLPVTPEQMKLINKTISTEEAIAIAERSGGSLQLEESPKLSSVLVDYEYLTFAHLRDVEPEIVQILLNRETEVIQILKTRRRANP